MAGVQSMQPIVALTESGVPTPGNTSPKAASAESGAGTGAPSEHLNPLQFAGHLAEDAVGAVGDVGVEP
jgi:hypothetical protein